MRWNIGRNVVKPYVYTTSPSVIIQGTADRTIDWSHSVNIYKTLFPEAAYHYIEGAAHKLTNEAHLIGSK